MNDRRLPPTHREVIYPYPDEPDCFSECPRCEKRTLYQRSAHYFICLWCGFRRDISEPEPSFLSTVLMLLTLVVLILLIL